MDEEFLRAAGEINAIEREEKRERKRRRGKEKRRSRRVAFLHMITFLMGFEVLPDEKLILCPNHLFLSFVSIMSSQLRDQSKRQDSYKNKGQFKQDELRRRREEAQVEIRKQKREESMAKRRNLNFNGAESGADTDEEGDESINGGAFDAQVSCKHRRSFLGDKNERGRENLQRSSLCLAIASLYSDRNSLCNS